MLTQDKRFEMYSYTNKQNNDNIPGKFTLNIKKKMLKCCHWEDSIESQGKY